MRKKVIEQSALRITVIYILIGSLWILFSDNFIRMVFDNETVTLLSVLKGWLFIVLTGGMLYRLIAHSHEVLKQQNFNLTMLNEEQLAAEEELRQQLEELISRDEEIRRQNLVLTSLHNTALGLMNRLDLDELLMTIVSSAAKLIDTIHAHIILVDKEKGVFERKIGLGVFADNAWRSIRLTEGLVGQVYREGKIIALDDYSKWGNRLNAPIFAQVNATVQVPLKSQSEVVGILGLAFTNSERKFGRNEIDLLSRFAELASIALDNANLFTTYKNELAERLEAEKALQTSEASYRAIFDAANDGILVYDVEAGIFTDINRKACEIYGHSREKIIRGGLAGSGIGKFPYSEQEGQDWLRRAAKGEAQLFEWMIQNKSGELIWVEINLKLAAIGNKQCILAVLRDISERKKKELELSKTQATNQALIDAIPDIMFLIKRDGTFMNYKAKKEETLYLPPEGFLGKTVLEVLPGELAQQTMMNVENAIISGSIQMFEYHLIINDNIEYYEARIAQSGDDEAFVIIRNISDNRQMKQQLEYLSFHDSLTGLYNRAYFEEEMKRLGAARDGVAGVIICDMDGLKLINDTLGHSMGDEVLKAIANVLRRAFRPDDIVARIGGDEFAVILPSDSVPLFEDACRRIAKMIKEYNSNRPTVPLSLSTGFAVGRGNPIDINALFKEADNKMYREKLHRQQSGKSAIVQALMKALEARDFITEGHGDRLQGLVVALAVAIGLPEQNLADLRLLARFHDIGKVGIPDDILFKPGRLTAEEFIVMQGHCEIGYRIAKSALDLEPIADWILKHQEWWNGQGYPLGIKGREIPIECRILSIVDAYDAMINDRPYRKAMSQEAAIAELRKCAGKQFDPELVEPFIQILSQGSKEQHDQEALDYSARIISNDFY